MLLVISGWFQLMWFIAVIGRNEWQWLLILAISAALIATWRRVATVGWGMIAVIGVGILIDSVNVHLGVFTFPSEQPELVGGRLLPAWLMTLWVCFAWYVWMVREWLLNFSISLIAVIASVGGALSYFAGFKLGAVDWPLGLVETAAILALEWFLLSLLVVTLLKSNLGRAGVTS
ncbi:DUF2878 domain-containing protein [Vibrio sp. SCSIO 43136]|uniref:DUF2878 domain-containing protein n=1 Tax=Vibrio sp. SCSIO 43136 TaxID=2819101 RepID=UPI002074BAB7|nr:DUF2878 domain-containing protein [Vibrio sp. SCSIO 43136]USD64365.1 DUF2878 domain-containing protein [Vibrio sp. SCSIO 43136]